MSQKNVRSLALGAAVAGILAGAALIPGCPGDTSSKSNTTEQNGCGGPNGCGGENGCGGPNGCGGHEQKKDEEKK